MFFYPGLLTWIPGAILTWIAADTDCNLAHIRRAVSQELRERTRDK